MIQDPQTASIEQDLERLQTGLRQLKIQYHMFFAGSVPRQPVELRSELERLMKRLSAVNIQKYHHRFQLNSLLSRYNTMTELWTKHLRVAEEGDRPAPPVADRAAAEKVLTTCRVQDPAKEQTALRLLHERYLEARRKAGERDDKLSFQAFVKGVQAQTQRLRDRTGCEQVELRIVVQDRKVQLKARPGR